MTRDKQVINHGSIRIELDEDGSVKIVCDGYLIIQPITSNSITIINSIRKVTP